MRGIADLMVRSAAKPRVSTMAAEGVDGWISCNKQGIYSRFTSMAASSVAGASQMKRAAEAAVWLLSSTADGAGMALHANARRVGAGRNSNVDFLLHRFGATVKKMGVKSHVRGPAPISRASCFRKQRILAHACPATCAADRARDCPGSPEALQNQEKRCDSYVLTAIASGLQGGAVAGRYPG